jgi:hypothetical protein
VHFQHARAGNERQWLAVVRIFIFLAILSIGGNTAITASSATATTTAAAAAGSVSAATAATATIMAASAPAAGLPVAVTSTATTATAPAATPTAFPFTHVLQNLKQNSKSGETENNPDLTGAAQAYCRGNTPNSN